ncbi:MAG: leucine-rich repeat domain-containing protein [Treponema sp.]|jgi:hypothetical protein|nr:leucine-rich repeat domain-containing protein [Treponema sp.]
MPALYELNVPVYDNDLRANLVYTVVIGKLMAVWIPVYSEEWIYYDTEDGLVIFDYTGKEKTVTIPAFIGGKPVKAVLGTGQYLCYRWGAFYEKGVESVIIGEGISAIWSNAFALGGLSSVLIPASVTCIGYDAFSGNKLTEIVIPPGVHTIEKQAFAYNCLTRAVISPGVRVIGERAFAYNTLTDITIPDTVTVIGEEAFTHNELTGINIPESVTGIGSKAFSDNRLTAAFIPRSLDAIGGGVFADNPALKAIVTDPENPSYTSVDGVLFSKDKTTLVSYPAGRGKEYAIPDGVKTIARFACAGSQLEQVFIPGGVTAIGRAAFSNNQLTSVTIPPGVKTIAPFAFTRNKVTSVTIGMDVKLGGGGAGGFDDGFDFVYKQGGKKAGTYTKTGDAWNYAPLDKELASAYLDIKTVARVKAKKAAAVLKKAAFVLGTMACVLPSLPVACFFLASFLVQSLLLLIVSIPFIPYLCIRLAIRLFKRICGGKVFKA